eukprot:GEMP01059118.1.p1 GENE.GEMP01059118.1~~GEMP01059118.1.p1  ORF type:complete len:381 (+),score=89.22 GEMP01059118.1:110-1252(+)
MQVGYIATRDCARKLCESLLRVPHVALDTEGVRLGRFGRLCVLQLRTPSQAYLCDALKDGVLDALKPVLQSSETLKVRVTFTPHTATHCPPKRQLLPSAWYSVRAGSQVAIIVPVRLCCCYVPVMHDCREDSAALYAQYGIMLNEVYDTQIAHRLLRPTEANVSFAHLAEHYLGEKEPDYCVAIKREMGEGEMWRQRPLSTDAVRYAVRGVHHLLALREVFNKTNPVDAGDVVSRSAHHTAYARLNLEIQQPKDAAKIGTQLWGMAAARKDEALYFKLNLGRTGVACTPSALSRFKDIEVGDTVRCVVSGVSHDGSFLYLDRYDHDWDFHEFNKRPKPAGTFDLGREVRHQTSALDTEGLDPLLLRVSDDYDGASDDEDK